MTPREENLVKEVVDKYTFAKDDKDNNDFNSNIDKWGDYYNGKSTELTTREERGLSALMPSWAQAGVDYVLAKEIAVIFGQRPYWAVGANARKWERAAKIATDRLTQNLDTSEVFLNVVRFIQDKLIFGISLRKPIWDRLENKAKLEEIDPKNFYPSPRGYTIYEKPWVIQRSLRDRDYIEEMGKNWKGSRKSTYKNTKELLANDGGAYIEEIAEESDKYTNEEQKNLYEILEYWDRIENKVITIGERKILLRESDSPYKKKKGLPFIVLIDWPKPKSFWGIGRIAAIELQIRELAHIKNQRFDNVNLILNPPFKFLEGFNVDLNALPIKPNALIGMDDINALQAIQFPFVSGDVYQEAAEIEKEIQNRLGLHEYWMGRAPEQRETATGIARLQAAGNTIFQFMNLLSLKLGMIEIASWMTAIDQQYFKGEISMPLLYDDDAIGEYRTITKSQLQGDFYFEPKTAPLNQEEIKDVKRSQFVTAVQTIISMQANLEMQALARILLEEFDIPQDKINKILPEKLAMPPGGEKAMGVATPRGGKVPSKLDELISGVIGRGTAPAPAPRMR